MTMSLLLGFVDDVLDVRWSVKIALSFLMAYPLCIAYDGLTDIRIPHVLIEYFGETYLHLGNYYLIYLAFTCVFCTNSINILAGINGLETGQSVVLAIGVLLHNFFELEPYNKHYPLLSIFIMLPFLSALLGLSYYNWYPSAVFVGDSFTYFAGMTFAVCGILGHFNKTLMLFFFPQLLNFAISLPQLFHFVPCPRHRVPKLNVKTGNLEPTYNFTLLNLFLYLFGPQTEGNLTVMLVTFQAVCIGLAFLVRYPLANLIYNY